MTTSGKDGASRAEKAAATPALVADNRGLVASNLGKSFRKRPVLRDASLRVQRGEAVARLW